MAEARIRIEIRLPPTHAALASQEGVTRQARIVQLIENGLIFEKMARDGALLQSHLERIEEIMAGASGQTPGKASSVGPWRASSPRQEQQALALMQSFGIEQQTQGG